MFLFFSPLHGYLQGRITCFYRFLLLLFLPFLLSLLSSPRLANGNARREIILPSQTTSLLYTLLPSLLCCRNTCVASYVTNLALLLVLCLYFFPTKTYLIAILCVLLCLVLCFKSRYVARVVLPAQQCCHDRVLPGIRTLLLLLPLLPGGPRQARIDRHSPWPVCCKSLALSLTGKGTDPLIFVCRSM